MTRITATGKYIVLSAATKVSPPPVATFAALYRDHVGSVWRTLRYLGVGARDVEDVAHEVFIVAQRRFDPSAPTYSPQAWLAGISRRVVMHYHRSQSRTERKKAEFESAPKRESIGPVDDVSRREAAEFVREFLETLAPAQREVFVLIDLEGMTAREVAEIVHTNPNTVSSRLRLARLAFERRIQRARRRSGTDA